MKICLTTAELTPFAKTGGLGDVCAALARYLSTAGHEVRVFLPGYSKIDTKAHPIRPVEGLENLRLRMGRREFPYRVVTADLPGMPEGKSLPVHLIDCPPLYHRDGFYASDGDEHLRFGFLTRAAIECCQHLGFAPDVFHAHDWHAALAPLYLKTVYSWDKLFRGTKTVLTIHNIGYQGSFGADVLTELELAAVASKFYNEDLKAGAINFLKTGILYADALTTVSPTHARELMTPEYGMGLDPLLRARKDRMVGLLNGVDYSEWDPRNDPNISFHFSPEDLSGKAKNKKVLLEGLGLQSGDRVPALGIVSRLAHQKGIDLMLDPLPKLLERFDIRFVALGSGEKRYENFFAWLQRRFPEKVCYYRGFSNELAHLIEAGADIFLMPSLYEPCGLNQMYSLRYGTAPVVRKTGGLADTVEHWNPRTRKGDGFVFEDKTPEAFAGAAIEALRAYGDREGWKQLMLNGMAKDYSWERQGALYIQLYERVRQL